jgi:hypothetical protein
VGEESKKMEDEERSITQQKGDRINQRDYSLTVVR